MNMKRLKYIVMLLGITVVVVVMGHQIKSNLTPFCITTELRIYKQGTEIIKGNIKNKTNEVLVCDSRIQLEYFSGGEWIELKEFGVPCFDLLAYEVMPKGERDLLFPVFQLSSLQISGKYRIVQKVYIKEQEYTSYVRFQVK